MRIRHLLAAMACAATAALTGCSQACHAIGGQPGVVIADPTVLTDLDAVAVTVCVTETACSTQALPATVDGPYTVDSELLSRGVTAVTVSATDVGGVEVYRQTKPITPAVSHPNGEGCEPTVWNATVEL